MFDPILDAYPRKIFDQKAYTRAELREAWGCSKEIVLLRCGDRVDSGEWEQVWKKVGHSDVLAYRLKERIESTVGSSKVQKK